MKSMSEFGEYFLDQEYQKIVGLGNRLGEIRDIKTGRNFDRSSATCSGIIRRLVEDTTMIDPDDKDNRPCQMAWSIRLRGGTSGN